MGILSYGYKASKLPKAIKSVKVADRLTERRKNTEDLIKIRQKYNTDPKKLNVASSIKKTSAINDKYDTAVKANKKKIKSNKKKAVGAAATVAVGGTALSLIHISEPTRPY